MALTVDFTIDSLNANLTIDPAPVANFTVESNIVANLFIEGTIGGSSNQFNWTNIANIAVNDVFVGSVGSYVSVGNTYTSNSDTNLSTITFTPTNFNAAPVDNSSTRMSIASNGNIWVTVSKQSLDITGDKIAAVVANRLSGPWNWYLDSGSSNVTGYSHRVTKYLNNQFVSVWNDSANNRSFISYTSDPTSVAWTSVALTSNYFFDINYANSIYIAVGANGNIVTSTNLSTWTQRLTNPGTSELQSIVYGNSVWLAVGDSKTYRSTDNGLNWSNVAAFGNSPSFRVDYGQGAFVGVNSTANATSDSTLTVSTDNGTTWTLTNPVPYIGAPGSPAFANIKYDASSNLWFVYGATTSTGQFLAHSNIYTGNWVIDVNTSGTNPYINDVNITNGIISYIIDNNAATATTPPIQYSTVNKRIYTNSFTSAVPNGTYRALGQTDAQYPTYMWIRTS